MGKGHRTDAKAAWAGAEKACHSVGKRGSAEKNGFQSTETALMAADRQKGARPPRFQVPCFNTTDPRFRGEEEKLLSLDFLMLFSRRQKTETGMEVGSDGNPSEQETQRKTLGLVTARSATPFQASRPPRLRSVTGMRRASAVRQSGPLRRQREDIKVTCCPPGLPAWLVSPGRVSGLLPGGVSAHVHPSVTALLTHISQLIVQSTPVVSI